MDNTFWHKQGTEALFPDLEWNKPERRNHAGKICIIGGNVHSLNAPAKAYETIQKTGPSAIKIVLPDKTKPLIGKVLPEALYLPSTASGEFARDGEVELLDHLIWADTILLPGDVGRNSETTILLEDSLEAYEGLIVLTRDALDSLSANPDALLSREKTTLVVSFAQLQKLIKNLSIAQALTFSMDLVKLVDFLKNFTQQNNADIITLHQNQLIVASSGRISTTKLKLSEEPQHWRADVASLAACYQTWYPNQAFEACTEAVFQFISKS